MLVRFKKDKLRLRKRKINFLQFFLTKDSFYCHFLFVTLLQNNYNCQKYLGEGNLKLIP